MPQLLDDLAHGRHVDDLEDRIDILHVDLPDERDLRRQGVQGFEVDIGGAVSEDEGLVVHQALVVVGGLGGGVEVRLVRALVGKVLRRLAQLVQLQTVSVAIEYRKGQDLPRR